MNPRWLCPSALESHDIYLTRRDWELTSSSAHRTIHHVLIPQKSPRLVRQQTTKARENRCSGGLLARLTDSIDDLYLCCTRDFKYIRILSRWSPDPTRNSHVTCVPVECGRAVFCNRVRSASHCAQDQRKSRSCGFGARRRWRLINIWASYPHAWQWTYTRSVRNVAVVIGVEYGVRLLRW